MKIRNQKSVGVLAMLGAFVAVPLIHVERAEARPPRMTRRETTARRGVVTRDVNGRQFRLRADNGSTYLVRTLRAEPTRLSRGDRVEVRGYNSDDNVFIAQRVIILRNR